MWVIGVVGVFGVVLAAMTAVGVLLTGLADRGVTEAQATPEGLRLLLDDSSRCLLSWSNIRELVLRVSSAGGGLTNSLRISMRDERRLYSIGDGAPRFGELISAVDEYTRSVPRRQEYTTSGASILLACTSLVNLVTTGLQLIDREFFGDAMPKPRLGIELVLFGASFILLTFVIATQVSASRRARRHWAGQPEGSGLATAVVHDQPRR